MGSWKDTLAERDELARLLMLVATAPIDHDGVRQGMRYEARRLNWVLLRDIRAALHIDGQADG